MTWAEVEAIVRPSASQFRPAAKSIDLPGVPAAEIRIWGEGSSWLQVTFKDGRVTDKKLHLDTSWARLRGFVHDCLQRVGL